MQTVLFLKCIATLSYLRLLHSAWSHIFAHFQRWLKQAYAKFLLYIGVQISKYMYMSTWVDGLIAVQPALVEYIRIALQGRAQLH